MYEIKDCHFIEWLELATRVSHVPSVVVTCFQYCYSYRLWMALFNYHNGIPGQSFLKSASSNSTRTIQATEIGSLCICCCKVKGAAAIVWQHCSKHRVSENHDFSIWSLLFLSFRSSRCKRGTTQVYCWVKAFPLSLTILWEGVLKMDSTDFTNSFSAILYIILSLMFIKDIFFVKKKTPWPESTSEI
jgi:hypothetical protein